MAAKSSGPEHLLDTLHKAVQHFRDTPGRRGRIVTLNQATDVLVAGDMHGNVPNFELLLKKADLAKNPNRHLVVQELVHGELRYPGGGDQSHQLLDRLATAKCEFPRQIHMLMGNHELAQWTGQCIAKDEEGDLTVIFRKGVDTAFGPLGPEIYAAYVHLFAIVPLAVRTPNRVFMVHSVPDPSNLPKFHSAILERNYHKDADIRAGGVIYSLLWDRDTSGATAKAFLEKVDADLIITGHVPCEKGFAVPNDRQVILDSLETPACYCHLPANRPITHKELVDCVKVL